MAKIVLMVAVATTLLAVSTPASAQYLFDRRWDPQQCSWRDICDYGGRAYIVRRAYASRCPIVEMERRLPDGTIAIDRRRQCAAVSVRG